MLLVFHEMVSQHHLFMELHVLWERLGNGKLLVHPLGEQLVPVIVPIKYPDVLIPVVNVLMLSSLLSPSLQLQRLKRSLSFKTLMRSKSVENFFQKSYSDTRLPPDFITDPPPPSPPPGSPLASERSPSLSPSLSPNPSLCSHSPSLSPSPSLSSKAPPPARPVTQVTHCFQEHVFRKPTHCQLCKHLIVGKVPTLLPGL